MKAKSWRHLLYAVGFRFAISSAASVKPMLGDTILAFALPFVSDLGQSCVAHGADVNLHKLAPFSLLKSMI